ncbi:MAG: DNA-directed polymerase subunit [Candidatus Thermoplasmatota archaeon]|nr:DNA-directed polymerase subunit [Candidatus Thermoplasmatota archaeon]
MYVIASKEDVVRIPPNLLGEDFEALSARLTQESFQNKVEADGSYTVLVRNIDLQGDGRIIHGDGAVYQKVKFETVMFRPTLHEIVEGTVCEVLKFGAFVRFGPLDGLLHISQIMDDRIDVDVDGRRLVGKDTKREIRLGDSVRARIVSLSINERSPRESKIGLTMRQPGLGKLEWLQEDRKKKEEKK